MRRVASFAIGVAVAAVGARHSQAAAAGTTAAPRLRAIAVAPTEIRLTVELADHSLDISAIGGPEGDPPRSSYMSVRQEPRHGRWATHGTAILSARPDTTYRFHARAQVTRGNGTEPRESADCVVRTPPEPREPPATPAAVTVAAASPFTLEVAWRFDGASAYGFEIHRRDDTGAFRRVGVAEPDARRFIDHGHRPSTTSAYRVRSFNPRGVSAWSLSASGETRRLADLPALARSEKKAKCTNLNAEASRIGDEASLDGVPAKTQVCKDIVLDGDHRVDAMTVPAMCGAQNCGWTLYGDVEGCYRPLGSFTLVSPECPRFETMAVAGDGWPVLRAYAHESAMASWVTVHVFLHGAYVDVDRYVECASNAPVRWTTDRESAEEDPRRWAPPFTGCWQQ